MPACRASVQFNAVTAEMLVQDLERGRTLKSSPVTMILGASELALGACNGTVPQITSKNTSPTNRLTELRVSFGATKDSEVFELDLNELEAEFHNVGQNRYQVDTLSAPEKFNGTLRFSQSADWSVSSLVSNGVLSSPTNF